MADFQIDFENAVGRYEIEPASAEEVKEWRQQYPKNVERMPDLVAEYRGYPKNLETMPDTEAALYIGSLVRKGKFKKVRLTSDKLEKSVRALVECKETPFHQVALKVANAIGGWPGDKHTIHVWRDVAFRLRLLFARKAYISDPENWRGPMKLVEWSDAHERSIGTLGYFLIPNEAGQPVLALRPEDFQDALVLYGARMLATGTNFQTCEHCKSPFLSGAGQKRRGDARFCSDECRYGFHNARRRKRRL